jgi:hypothetical protein
MSYLPWSLSIHFNLRRIKHILNNGASGLTTYSHKPSNGAAHTKKDHFSNQIQANKPEPERLSSENGY